MLLQCGLGLGRGLFSRAVVILDADGKVIYTEQVPEISNEPNYDAAITALAERRRSTGTDRASFCRLKDLSHEPRHHRRLRRWLPAAPR